eukprot:869999-Prymnesium_polylepis.1
MLSGVNGHGNTQKAPPHAHAVVPGRRVVHHTTPLIPGPLCIPLGTALPHPTLHVRHTRVPLAHARAAHSRLTRGPRMGTRAAHPRRASLISWTRPGFSPGCMHARSLSHHSGPHSPITHLAQPKAKAGTVAALS